MSLPNSAGMKGMKGMRNTVCLQSAGTNIRPIPVSVMLTDTRLNQSDAQTPRGLDQSRVALA